MEITIEIVNKHLAELGAEEERLLARLNALAGMKADCQHWLQVLDKKVDAEAGDS